MTFTTPGFRSLEIGIIGGGLGGLAAGIALCRAGHNVSIYERRDFKVEVGASISCAANGGNWLRARDVDIAGGKLVTLEKLVMRDWQTGDILNDQPYYMFHRVDMHKMLLKTATDPAGKGSPCSVVVDHIATRIDVESGIVTFENGAVIQKDLIIGADGIRSAVRSAMGVIPNTKSANQTCYRCNVRREDIESLGLMTSANNPAIQFWGGFPQPQLSQYYKIVMSPCAGGEIVSFYCFMPTKLTNHTREGFTFSEVPVSDILAGKYANLDKKCVDLINNSVDLMPWRLYIHQPYLHWHKGVTCLMGDAAHPMMPHQSQGACIALEDAAALGIIFGRDHDFTHHVKAGLALYEQVCRPRATWVQAASACATENLNERIGFTSMSAPELALAASEGYLTVNKMNDYDMQAHILKLCPVRSI